MTFPDARIGLRRLASIDAPRGWGGPCSGPGARVPGGGLAGRLSVSFPPAAAAGGGQGTSEQGRREKRIRGAHDGGSESPDPAGSPWSEQTLLSQMLLE